VSAAGISHSLQVGKEQVFSLDTSIARFVNSFAHRSWTLDTFVCFLASSHLFKGVLVMAVFCFLWFQASNAASRFQITEKRGILLHSLLICIPGLVAARWLARVLPFRQRPLFIPSLHLNRAYGFDSDALEPWSSFPSDHAVLFFALATGIWLVNKKAGLFLYFYTIVCIALPRIFLGIHYPTDILAGALLGFTLGYSAKFDALRSVVVARSASRLQEFSPGLFYACWFFLVCQTAVLYGPLRGGIEVAREILHAWIKGVH